MPTWYLASKPEYFRLGFVMPNPPLPTVICTCYAIRKCRLKYHLPRPAGMAIMTGGKPPSFLFLYGKLLFSFCFRHWRITCTYEGTLLHSTFQAGTLRKSTFVCPKPKHVREKVQQKYRVVQPPPRAMFPFLSPPFPSFHTPPTNPTPCFPPKYSPQRELNIFPIPFWIWGLLLLLLLSLFHPHICLGGGGGKEEEEG